MPITPTPGLASQINVGGQAVMIAGAVNGGILTNPAANTDQGVVTSEILYVDPVGVCGGSALPQANGTVFALQPGQSWTFPPGQTTPTYVNAASTGHKFTVVIW